jgi:hypothetical protein
MASRERQRPEADSLAPVADAPGSPNTSPLASAYKELNFAMDTWLSGRKTEKYVSQL